MAITQAMCTSFKVELFTGTHVVGTDTFKIALYTSAAALDATTTAYSVTNEVVGTGYSAGGATLTIATSPTSTSTTAFMSFSNPSWAASTITARGALIYNSNKSNKAVAVIDFGSDKISTAGTFAITMPTADATNAILRLV